MRPERPLPDRPARPGATIVATETFELMKVPAPAGLSHLVHDIALYRERSGAPIRQVEIASLVVPVLIGFAEPFEIALGREPGKSDAYQSFTSGLCLKPVNIRSAGGCSCLEFTLTPLGARLFFGLPMSELTERMLVLDDVNDRPLARLRERLGNEPDWNRRFDLAAAFLTLRLREAPAANPATNWAYQTIVASGGRISVEALATKLDWSRKHLAARFRQEIGLPPKQVARIARFSRAQTLAVSRRENGWADIAAACGYADQAHLVREFREFSGSTPAAWLAVAA
ncbi:AraC family transcriptional regulator [Mesorhizobium sp. CAU 1732]|uniref:helix-turn-helix domain-containing protein n=1 Tax=Mesorhizobium sp. CAU 1732 TaxID=3140358 RepID=UPI0032618918